MSMLKVQLGHLGGGSAPTRFQLWTKPVMISRLQSASLLRTGNMDASIGKVYLVNFLCNGSIFFSYI